MLTKLLRYLRWIESGALVALFAAMLIVACAQILARNFFGTGFIWGEELTRMAVLWITMIGGLAAVGQRSHIRIDLAERFVPKQWFPALGVVANLASSLVCFVLGYFSIKFVLWEFEDGYAGIGVIPSWILVSVIPFAGFAMGLRFAIQTFVRPSQ